MAAIRVQVAAAEGGGSYAEDGVGWLLDGGHGTVFHGDLRDSVEQEGVGRRGGMEGWDGGVGWRGGMEGMEWVPCSRPSARRRA